MTISPNRRLASIRIREGVSPRSMGLHLGITTTAYQAMEGCEHKLTVKELVACAKALDVPITEFFDEPDKFVKDGSAVVLAYKSAVTLKKALKQTKNLVIVNRLIEQLERLLPNINRTTHSKIKGWPVVGQRRTPDEISGIELKVIDTSHFPNSISFDPAEA